MERVLRYVLDEVMLVLVWVLGVLGLEVEWCYYRSIAIAFTFVCYIPAKKKMMKYRDINIDIYRNIIKGFP